MYYDRLSVIPNPIHETSINQPESRVPISSIDRRIAGLFKTARLLTTLVGETANERLAGEARFDASRVTDEKSIIRNRQLSTNIFFRLGHLTEDDIDMDQWLPRNDPYHQGGDSVYFSTYDRNNDITPDAPQAATRLLWNSNITIDKLRTPLDQMHPGVAEFLGGLDPGRVAEIGGLAKVPGVSQIATLALFRSLIQFSEEKKIDYLVAGLEPKVFPSYKTMFGDALRLLHQPGLYVNPPGSHGDKIGVILNVANAATIYRRDMIKGQPRGIDWLYGVTGVRIDSEAFQRIGVKERMGKLVMGSVMYEYFSNKVPSFSNK